MKNVKTISLLILMSLAALSAGCSTQVAKVLLGDKFVTANDGLNHCDLSGIAYLEKEAKGDNDFMATAAALTLGAHYATVGNDAKVNEMAHLLAANSNGKQTVKDAKKDILEGAKSTEKDRLSNHVSPTCR